MPSVTAELEALLLENAARAKTTEQKVRSGKAWEEIEKEKAKQRQRTAARNTNQKLGRGESETLMQNCAEASKGTTRDAIALKVELGSGFTYSKAAKVVHLIDSETNNGKLVTATALRFILNEQSINAAAKLVKQPSTYRDSILALIASGQAKDTKEAQQILYEQQERPLVNHTLDEDQNKLEASSQLSSTKPSACEESDILLTDSNKTTVAHLPQPKPACKSCWNCQHRGETIDNQHIYCYWFGGLPLIDKSADTLF